MSSSDRLRFTLGQLMAFTAVFAFLLAAAISERWRDASIGPIGTLADPKFLCATAIRFAGVGVCLYHLRLSRGMWLVLIGYIGPWLAGIATGLTIAIWYSSPNVPFPHPVARVGWLATQLLSLVFVVGLATTFRDVRRRLSNRSES
jgi:hypothetical protein